MSVRYVLAEVYTENPLMDEEGKFPIDTKKEDQKEYKWLASSIDLWEVQQVREGLD